MNVRWIVIVMVALAAGCSKDKGDAGAKGSASSTAAPGTAPAPGPGSAAPAASSEADPWSKDVAASASNDPSGDMDAIDPAGGDELGDPSVDDGADPSADDDATAAAVPNTGGTAIQRLCARDAECGCPIDDCENFFKKAGLPDSVFECFVKQSCDSLCAKDSGAPGSTLHTACMKGVVQQRAPATGRKSCRTDRDCGGNFDCCGGLCYQMGTSLWQTHCMMPSGKF